MALKSFPRIHTCNSCSHIFWSKQVIWFCLSLQTGGDTVLPGAHERETNTVNTLRTFSQDNDYDCYCICWGLTSYICAWNSPKPAPHLRHWFLFSAALNLTQDNCHYLPWQCLTFSFFQEKNSSEKGAIFFFNWWSFPRYSTISLLSDPLATEESKRGPVINDMIGKVSAEGPWSFLPCTFKSLLRE